MQLSPIVTPRHNNGIKTNMHIIADSNFPKEIDIG